MQNTANYNQQRSVANAQNRLSAKNFQEYLATTGRANSGLSAQARMQYGNNLNSSINTLNAGEAAALADIGRRRTLANDAYNSGLVSANAKIEADYINNLLNQRERELNRQLQEKQFNESVRQFNENMKFQREQLQSRFSGGSGGGGRTTGSSNIGTEVYGSAPASSKPSGYDAIKVGQIYRVDDGKSIKWYQKTANGKDIAVGSPYGPVQGNAKARAVLPKPTAKKNTAKKNTTAKKTNPFPKKTF